MPHCPTVSKGTGHNCSMSSLTVFSGPYCFIMKECFCSKHKSFIIFVNKQELLGEIILILITSMHSCFKEVLCEYYAVIQLYKNVKKCFTLQIYLYRDYYIPGFFNFMESDNRNFTFVSVSPDHRYCTKQTMPCSCPTI